MVVVADAQGDNATLHLIEVSGCLSVTFPSDELTYSHVCGKVLGYQYYSPDGIVHVGSDINGAVLV